MEYIIGVDIGTSGTKAIAFTNSGLVLNSAYVSYPGISEHPGEQELNPVLLLDATIKTIADVIRDTGTKGLSGICFSSAMHSLIAVDKSGTALTNVITWADLRSKLYAAKIKGTPAGKEIYERTGTPIHPMSPLCKIMWMKDNKPEIFNSAYKFISIKEYIWFHFFGNFSVDYSIASGTGLFDIYSCQWYEKALTMAGIRPDHLSTAVSPQHIETNLNNSYQLKMGLPAKTAFIIGGSDGCLANLGSNAIAPGEMALTIGTSGAVRMTSTSPKHDSKERIFNYILTESLYVSGGPVNNGGNTVKWYVENFMEKPGAGPKDFSTYMQVIDDIPAGSGGLIFLPYLYGERAPVWDANAKGVFFGILPNHTAKFFLRAVIEGISFSLYQIGLSLEETIGKIEKIYASGGFIQSTAWLQMIADIFNKDVYVMNVADASAIGAAIIGQYALGKIKNLEESRQMISVQKTYFPDEHRHSIYMKNFSVFERLYDKLKDEFDRGL